MRVDGPLQTNLGTVSASPTTLRSEGLLPYVFVKLRLPVMDYNFAGLVPSTAALGGKGVPDDEDIAGCGFSAKVQPLSDDAFVFAPGGSIAAAARATAACVSSISSVSIGDPDVTTVRAKGGVKFPSAAATISSFPGADSVVHKTSRGGAIT